MPENAPAPLPEVERGVVIAGDGAGDVARLVAEAHGWPLLAEPTSGARAGGACIDAYLDLLESRAGQELAAQVHQVVVIGRPTLSRPIQDLIAHAPSLIVANYGARWREVPRHAERVLREVPDVWTEREDGGGLWRDSPWLSQWHDASRDLEVDVPTWGRRAVAAVFLASLGPGDIGVLGSSGPIRAVDRIGPPTEPGGQPVLLANRGLSGIDGTVSTSVGVALGAGRPVQALMGDVTFLHDVGGLLVGPRERRPRLRIVVINDGGGTIFTRLEHSTASPDHVERVFVTPHGVDLGAVCAGYRVPHTAVTSADALARAVCEPPASLEVVEAVLKA